MLSMKKQEKQRTSGRSPFIKITAVLCTVLTALSLVSCTKGETRLYEKNGDDSPSVAYSANDNRTPTDSLRIGWSQSTPLNPFFITANLNFDMICLMYQSLYKTDTAYIPYEQIAKSAVQKDPLNLTVELNSSIRFSDSSPLTSSDVVYSFNQAKNSDLYSSQLKNIDSASSAGTYTVNFKLNSADKFVKNVLTFPVVKSGTASSKDSIPVGSGMFKYSDSKLVYNSSYSGSKPSVGTVELYPVSESATLALALESGNIDCVFDDLSSGSYLKVAASNVGVNLNNLVFLGMNSSSSALSLPQVRQAVNFAVNRVDIVSDCYSGFASNAYTVFNPKWSEYFNSGYDESELALNYDSASSLLKSAGYPQCNLTLIVNEDNTFRSLAADKIKESLKNVNINVTVSKLTWSEYTQALSDGSYDLYLGEMKFSDNMDLSALFSTYGVASSSPSAAAYQQYKNSQITMRDFLSIFNSDVPLAPVCYRQGVFIYSRNITGRLDCAYGNIFKNLEEWNVTETKNTQK